jgi:hypothetical protein
MRYLIPILLFFLLLIPATAQEENLFPMGILENGISVIEELPSLEPHVLFEQEGDWHISEGMLCNSSNHECTEALAQFDLYDPSMSPACEETWSNGGFITESPNHEWLIFTDCGTNTFPRFYSLFAYHLSRAELIELGITDYTDYLEAVAWLDNERLLLGSGDLRSSGSHAIDLIDLEVEPYIETIVRQFAYKPRYFADSRLVLWGEGVPDSSNSFLVSARRIYAYDVDSQEEQILAQIDYTEAQQADSTVAFPIALNDELLLVGDRYPLNPNLNLYFFDRHTGELLYRASNLANDESTWQVGLDTQLLYYSAYTYDGFDINTTHTLKQVEISHETITETPIMMSRFSGELVLSDDENYLLIAWAEEDIVQIYNIQEETFYPLLSTASACGNCRFGFEWLSDNTLIVSIEEQGHWRICIDALSEEQS